MSGRLVRRGDCVHVANVHNGAAILSMGDETLTKIAVNLVWAVQPSATIDWSLRHSVRTAIRSKIRRLLAKV